MNIKTKGLYIHVPFCERKCEYCGFYSFPMDEKERETKCIEILEEVKRKKHECKSNEIIDTVFIGGGTPSLLTCRQIISLMDAVYDNFPIQTDAEITIELNPNSTDEEKLKTYKSCGINRLSIGVQSFDNTLLKTLGRLHDAAEAEKIYRLARKTGFKNINLDLMFAIAGQNIKIWEETLNKTISLKPEHISFYSLQIEEGTPFYKAYKDGSLPFVSDELMNKMYLKASTMLKEAGYLHYEISNAAKAGYFCRHNMKYWTMHDFIGVGDGACGFVDGIRYENGKERKKESLEESMSIFCFTALRTSDGIDKKAFKKRFCVDIEEVFPEALKSISQYEKDGFVSVTDEYIRLTEKGFLISNDLMCEFV